VPSACRKNGKAKSWFRKFWNKGQNAAFAPEARPSWRATRETEIPRGDKSSYTDKQKRKAEHIEEGYQERGVSKDEAERRAWATVNKESGGGNKSGSGRTTAAKKRKKKTVKSSTTKTSVKRTKAKKSRKAANAAKTRARDKQKGVSARKRKY